MKIKNNSIAGTLESNDILISIFVEDDLIIELESNVKDQFGDHIIALVKGVISEYGITSGRFILNDKGALDFSIKARLITVIERSLQ